MNISEIFEDKSLKAKAQTTRLSEGLMQEKISTMSLIAFAQQAKDSHKATCIEAIEFATQSNPDILDADGFLFMIQALAEKAPRVKWESAKVIGNTAHLHKTLISQAVDGLLKNAVNDGTVVRWSAAFALGEIAKLNTLENSRLLPIIEKLCMQEEKNSIQKIYLAALKKSSFTP